MFWNSADAGVREYGGRGDGDLLPPEGSSLDRGEDLVGGHYIGISEDPDGSKEFERDFHRVRRRT